MKLIYCCIILSFFITGCSLEFPPEDEVSDPDAITSSTSAQRALAAAYTSYNEYYYALDFVILSDDLQPTDFLSRKTGMQNTYLWDEKALIFISENIWKGNYETIAKVNVLLERINKIHSANSSENEELKIIKAQASYLKALCYFQILKCFSPRYLSENYEEYGLLLKKSFVITEQQNRSSFSESIKVLRNLLKKQQMKDVSCSWLTTEGAQYLSAEIELWTENYQGVLDYAKPLYEKYLPILENENPENIWSKSESKLRLFALNMQSIETQPYTELGWTENDEFLKVNQTIKYATEDIRNGIYVDSSKNKKDLYLGKYRAQSRKGELISYYTKYRVSGLVFLCAEAYLKLGNKDEAVKILNHFLSVRKSENIDPTIDKDALLERILLEKQKEFVGEPERFFDLKRNHKPITRYIMATSIVIPPDDHRWTFPIPLSEKKHNQKITQNKGWEYINTIN